MSTLDLWIQASQFVFQWQNMLLIFGVSLVGLIIGFLPGIGPLNALTLFLPITYGMAPASGIMVLAVLYMSCIYGGSISAILLNTPGTASSAATCFDGYPMAQKGEAGKAIGISMMSSFVGGYVGLAGLIFLSPLVAKVVLNFQPAEYFMLAALGLVLISASARDGMAKALIAGAFGALTSCVGLDLMTGQPRFQFGIDYLIGGIPFIPLIIGLFAFSEVIVLIVKGKTTIAEKGKLSGSITDGLLIPFRHMKTLIRSVLVGFGIGVIPGEGAAVANFTCYLIEAKVSKRGKQFGTGIPEGIIAPEASNNACVSGALVPTLTLGIPGGGVAAILMGGIMVHGINPGPELFTSHLDVLYTLFFGLICANLLLFVSGVVLSGYIARITVIPINILTPSIIILGVVSTYVMRNNFVDVGIAIAGGIVGYFMRRYGFSPVAFLVAFILSPIAEGNFFQALMISDNGAWTFVTRPISASLLAIIIGIVIIPPIIKKFRKDR